MPTPYRYTTPVPRQEATGLVAATYAQIAAEFILTDGPLMSLSPAPELLAATWALMREAQIAGDVPRRDREIVATAVSVANSCRFCIDAHTALVLATGEEQFAAAIWRGEAPAAPAQAALFAWAQASTAPGMAARSTPPFPAAQGAEFLGTVLVTHFFNRMVSALLNEHVLSSRLQRSPAVSRAISHIVQQRPPAGLSLPLLADIPAGAPPPWAGETPLGVAYAALRDAAAAGGSLLSWPARDLVVEAIAGWQGADTPLVADGLEVRLAELAPGDRPGARLALLAAWAPLHVSDADVSAWRVWHGDDAALVRLLAFGAMSAVERISQWTVPATQPAPQLAAGD